jgi:hypothetical protein
MHYVPYFVAKKECMKYKNTLGEYPQCYRGVVKCHLRTIYTVLPLAAKLALFKKSKCHEASMIQKMPSTVQGPKKGKVFQLRKMHWVSICLSF